MKAELTCIMDIERWLRDLGLDQYEVAFRENAIDETVLPSLTVEDLKDLGVSIVGHRRKLLDAISALKADPNAKAAPPSRVSQVIPSPKDSAERRQVTVMFSDLVGWTALGARMDPEDLHEVVSAYQKCVAEIAGRFNGFVAQYLGDGALVYFGYPEAHEDDAELAVRAALELVANVIGLKTRVSLQTRVGIATGLVVVGQLIASGEGRERGIVGETPNLAARLQGIAKPNMVVVAESTRRLLGNLFRFEDLGLQELKGIPKPAPAWAALEPSSVASRFEALRAAHLTAFVGREEEIELLVRRWSRTKTGEGQVVLLSGEAGIGKSRLTAALLELLAAEPHVALRYFCSPQHTASAFYPIIGQMERAAGLAHDDTPQARLDKLDALLVQTSTSKEEATLFAEMLSLPGERPALDMAPEQRRQRTLEALVFQVEALARQNPVIMIFEDAHWTDPTSLEVCGRLVDRIRTSRVLLVVTFRPEFEPPWIGQPHVTALTINRLTWRAVGAMIDRVIGTKPLPANIRQDIIERSDGIPLFVEEMTKAVLEAEGEGVAERVISAIPSPTVAVPATLHASLMARLDRLGTAKEVAQIGATLGRQFSHAMLAAMVSKPEAELHSALDRLVAAGLLFRQGVPPHAMYLFKHALVQEAAYSTLLREPRRALHARIAETLEGRFPEIVENQPELLARHCSEAGLIERAAILWGKAGERSLQRSALLEAIAHLTRALEQLAALPGTPALRREQMKLQVALITPLAHIKGYSAAETIAAVEKTRVLMEETEAVEEVPEDSLLVFSVLWGVWVGNYVAFNGEVLRDIATQFLGLAEKRSATIPRMIGHRLMGTTSLHTGRLAEGRAHLDRAITLYDPARHRSLATRFGQDARVGALAYRSVTVWMLGYPDDAVKNADDAIEDAREIGQAATLMYALAITGGTYLHAGDYTKASATINELNALADEKRASYWKACATALQGCLLGLTGEAADAIRTLTDGIAAWRSTGSRFLLPWYLSSLAKAHAECGHIDNAWLCIREAMTAVETTKETTFGSEVNRVAGEIAMMSPRPDARNAEGYFANAIAIAGEQLARSYELRSATSLARLWRDQGERVRARDVLSPIYGWFTEGFETADLREAKALLEMLNS
jgi:class 3 adenylate cyclase/predicted ATPase